MRTLVWLAVLGVVVYIGWSYAGPHYRAWRFRDAMAQSARLAGVAEVAEIRAEVLEAASDFGVPLNSRQLRVRDRPREGLSIAAEWEEIVKIDAGFVGTWVDTLRFDHEVTPEP